MDKNYCHHGIAISSAHKSSSRCNWARRLKTLPVTEKEAISRLAGTQVAFKASVLMTAFNSDRYIAQAIESVLMQQTTHTWELVIGEDCSQDRTREIVLNYKARFPERIRVILQPRNLRQGNVIATYQACAGEYIALLDGDDYWLYPHKLQRQIDFLDRSPDFSMCFHNVIVQYEDEDVLPHPFHCEQPSSQRNRMRMPKSRSNIEDLIKGNFVQTSSVLVRAGLFGNFPPWFLTAPVGDWPFHIFNAAFGDIGFMDECMAVYRVRRGSMYSSQSRVEQLLGAMTVAEKVNAHTNYHYGEIIAGAQKSRLHQILQIWARDPHARPRADVIRDTVTRYAPYFQDPHLLRQILAATGLENGLDQRRA